MVVSRTDQTPKLNAIIAQRRRKMTKPEVDDVSAMELDGRIVLGEPQPGAERWRRCQNNFRTPFERSHPVTIRARADQTTYRGENWSKASGRRRFSGSWSDTNDLPQFLKRCAVQSHNSSDGLSIRSLWLG